MSDVKFGVYERAVKALLGDKYALEKFVEGVDYKRMRVRIGTRVMFRNDILESIGGERVMVSPAQPAEQSEPQKQGDEVQEAVVTQRYPNPRYVNTTIGRVFVGGKSVKLGQKIRVRNSELALKPVSYLG
jgi:hypothetical protein